MELHESAVLHMLVKMGLKIGADRAFAVNPDASMDEDIIPEQAKQIHLLFSKYIKFPEDEYDLTIYPDNSDALEEEDDEN